MTSRLLTGATIWSGADCRPARRWLLLDGGVIDRIGAPGEPAPAAQEIVDLAGRHVLPGFIDTHTHLSVAAWMPRGIDGSGVGSLSEALGAVRRAARPGDEAGWLMMWNVSLHDWPEGRLPTADELDAAAPGRKVLVSGVDLHRGALSRVALESVHLGTGDDVTTNRRGRPTGEVWEAAFGVALREALADLEARRGDGGRELLEAEAERHLEYGVTHAHDPFVPPRTQRHLEWLAGRTPLRLSWAAGASAGIMSRPDPDAAPPGPYGEAGRELKIFLDGADRCALRLPLRAVPGLIGGTIREAVLRRATGPLREGMRRRARFRKGRVELPYLRMTDRELTGIARASAEQGLRIRLHALGNLAADQGARVLKAAKVPEGTATIDHLTVLDERIAARIADAGAYAGLQPGFLPRFGRQFATAGIDRHRAVLGSRLLLSAGAPLVLSSDHPCGPLDPLENLRIAVGRQLGDGRVLQAGQALSQAEAVRAATVTAARSLGIEDRGAISAGQVADLVICTGDPFRPETRVLETWIGGREVRPERRSA